MEITNLAWRHGSRSSPLRAALASVLILALAGCLDDSASAPRQRQADLERLGRLLSNDTNLSEPAGQSCASCHDTKLAFTDPDRDTPTSEGVKPGLFGSRNTPTVTYAAYSPSFGLVDGLYVGGQFLDGRAALLEDQAKGPFLNPVEMANLDKKAVVAKVRVAAYARLFRSVFGPSSLDDVEQAYEHIAQAIAAFERTAAFAPFSSKYDQFLRGETKLTQREAHGLDLFLNKANCAACHPATPSDDGSPPLFTDFSYDNLGVPRNPDNRFYTQGIGFNLDGANFVDLGLGGVLGQAAQNGKFKVPTLRNIAITAPYMHNGYFSDLRGVVRFYNDRDTRPPCADPIWSTDDVAQSGGCWPRPEVVDNVNRDELGDLHLTDDEVDALVAFLSTLTDGWQP